MCSHGTIQEHIGEIHEKRCNGRWHAHLEDLRRILPGYTDIPDIQGKTGLMLRLFKDHNKIDHGCHIGKRRCQSRTHDLISIGHENEHEQRIQNNVQDTAAGEAVAGLLGIADVSENV